MAQGGRSYHDCSLCFLELFAQYITLTRLQFDLQCTETVRRKQWKVSSTIEMYR